MNRVYLIQPSTRQSTTLISHGFTTLGSRPGAAERRRPAAPEASPGRRGCPAHSDRASADSGIIKQTGINCVRPTGGFGGTYTVSDRFSKRGKTTISENLGAALPAPDTKRWVARRKAVVVEAVRSGAIDLAEVCRRYNLSVEEFLAWERAIDRHGVPGLRVTRLQVYRDTEPGVPGRGQKDGRRSGRNGGR
jgi:hypothetical protein